ncbi:helix-turn-helix transcriptional regulator [Providencia stuartii]|uniref:Helix-turn-helix transcriptional regulator n=2 Tax=Providencia TaxID=586 RepID=A0A1S1HU11_PROST|nr:MULTISPECIES: helix-turn-helix transcriptional regulator [Providencia]MDV5226176.1 helix-turn-helix transcriptional regulator [Providencia rettgeri]ELR5041742.1 helix-turn-helix transcriptional regulator [Providencia stuartii]ELR5083573.1 helix-turn-helix transcriptional regulator [Providencia stuartii]ELR5112366.1 helix-turn-helix transcriptional regulator [Providencia stuartii]ELR5299280.1 helix-turn-helix transcriptional regulator [Providencia stuartii]
MDITKALNENPQKTSLAVGKILKNARKSKKYTGIELGKKINISQQQISSYERGVNNISLKLLFTILIELDLNLNDFIFMLNKELNRDNGYYHY